MSEKGKLSDLIKQNLQNIDKNGKINISEQLKKLEEKVLPINCKIPSETFKDFNDSIKKIVNKINSAVPNKDSDDRKPNQPNKTLKDYSIDEIFKAISNGLVYLNSAYTIRKFADAVEELTKTEKAIINALTLLSEAGFAPNKEIDRTFLKEINVCEEIENTRSQRKAIAELAINHYNSDKINSMFTQWTEHPLIKKRTALLKSAITAHIQKNYLLSIPVLLAQIEGIVMDGFYHVGQYGHDRLNLYLKDLITTQRSKNFGLGKNVYTNLFNNVMMVSFEKGVKEYSKSRHSILHGASYRYGKADYSLKLILFLDMIVGMFNYFSYGSSTEYHLVGCKSIKGRVLRTSKRPFTNYYFNKKSGNYIEKLITFYQSEDEAMRAGKTYCCKCIKK